CDYLSAGGSATISGNAVGCNNQTEIEDACGGFPDCPPGDITFASQVELDQFIIDYPDCTTIQGNLLIGDGLGFVDIDDVGPLQIITTVLGALYIQGTDLTDIDELSSLAGINGELWIFFNPLITSLDGLSNLTAIGNLELYIQGNNVLASLTGLENINPETIDYISIESNASLTVCNVLSVCTFITTLGNGGNIFINSNATGCNTPQEVQDSCIGVLPECPSGDFQFLTQEEVNHFTLQYPNCTQFPGDLRIGGTAQSDIDDLASLQDITSITGSLIVSKTSLTNLQGLNSLITINNGLSIGLNNDITSVNGLNNLSVVGSSITFLSNPSLTSIADLGPIQFLQSLHISSNDALINLEGLNQLTTVSTIGGSVDISSNASLESLDGLDLLAHGSVFTIANNPSLVSLGGLTSLIDPGSLTILNNESLTSIGNLSNLTSIEGQLSVIQNHSLTNFVGLNNLTIVSQLSITNNDGLTSLDGFEGLEEVEFNFNVSSNDNLLSLDGLDFLVLIGENIHLESNALLNDLDALGLITNLNSTLTVKGNAALTNLLGLHNITMIGTNGSTGRLIIENNPVLVGLTDLSSLESLGSNGALYIINNAILTSLEGLDNIDPSTMNYLQLESSINLSTCAVESICTYLSNGGAADISGNATGCVNQQEIEDECELIFDVNDVVLTDNVLVYPNPFNDWLHIETANAVKIERVYLFDVTGKQIRSIEVNSDKTKLFVSDLNEGMYFMIVYTNTGIVTQKIVK
ncbi:MAG: T9SS type A sorting domain-containing protein, partial [Flavobacteriaceae bacterium]|nr:T9SS type A sorting domain-containing protein [Flavobacteriaceae bacterium]